MPLFDRQRLCACRAGNVAERPCRVRVVCTVAYRGGAVVAGYTEWRRKFYLAKIEQAEKQAAKAVGVEAVQGFLAVAEGYRALLKRLEPQ